MNARQLPHPALVLIVDDEVRNVKLLETLLHADGHDTISASNGSEALILAASHHPISSTGLIFVEMPICPK